MRSDLLAHRDLGDRPTRLVTLSQYLRLLRLAVPPPRLHRGDQSSRFDGGYHAILYAYEAGSIWLPWESSVTIAWDVPTDFGTPVELSARTNWDAEYTHDWLLEEFIPQVLRWKNTPRQASAIKPSFWSRRAARPTVQQRALNVSAVASSSAIGLSLNVGSRVIDHPLGK